MTDKPTRKKARKVASRKKSGGKLLRLALENPDRDTGMVQCVLLRGGEVVKITERGLMKCRLDRMEGWPVKLPEEDLIPALEEWEAPVERES